MLSTLLFVIPTILPMSAMTPLPFVGLLDVDEEGRRRVSGRADCVEFWRARDEGTRCIAAGPGLLRPIILLTAKVPTTGDETNDGVLTAEVLVLVLYLEHESVTYQVS